MADANLAFCEQIGEAVKELGFEEAMKCMARAMTYIACNQQSDITVDSDLGQVFVKRYARSESETH